MITGDTGPCESVIELARGADAMLCMCWDDQERMDREGESEGTCGTIAAAWLAQRAGVERLVLVHSGPNLSSPGVMEKGIAEIATIYDGEVIWAHELMSFELARGRSTSRRRDVIV